MWEPNRATKFITHLLNQLALIYERTLNLALEVELTSQPVTDPRGATSTLTSLTPSPEQQIQAEAIYAEYRVWVATVIAFLRRHSTQLESEFLELAELLTTYILFRRSGTNISEKLWRELFARESRSVLMLQTQLIQTNAEAFSLVRPRSLIAYTEFALKINRVERQQYRVEAQCRLGEADHLFTLPFEEQDLDRFLLKHCQPRHGRTRGWTPRAVRPLADFGQKLFDTVLSGEIRDLFMRTRQASEAQQQGVRIKLRYRNSPELGNLPWEFLYDGRDFLCLSSTTPITRYLDSAIPARPLLVNPPFRLLVTVSSPNDLDGLDVDEEQQKLHIALAPLVVLGILKIDFTPDGTLRTLQKMLRTAEVTGQPYHIWHYIGHGRYDEAEETSVLLFEDEHKAAHNITGFELGTMFNGYPSLKLAVLNACEGARTNPQDPLAGVAAALVERGMPAVVAMQFEITDEAAIVFADEFYMALVDGLPVDVALAEARRSIFFLPNHLEWATPVLFMRVENGVLFDIQSALGETILNET